MNKFYIQIVLFLLTISIYMNNKTLAIELGPGEDATPESTYHYLTYFYALATKVEISENKTIVVMTSANINDHNPSNKKYKNEIVKSANLFETDIDSEDDIKQGKLKKTFANLIGYLIEKRDRYIHVIYVDSIGRHCYGFLKVLLEKLYI
ncbi:fam-a protein, partial [Plasmodium yoelii]